MAAGIARLRDLLPGEVQHGLVVLIDLPPGHGDRVPLALPLTRDCDAVAFDAV
ncbi:MAG: hypothetical protein FJ087_15420 [Deltaproteobacteria bacterium]|nr:hypothetical protein [Deltaproteobacteria bacterium]